MLCEREAEGGAWRNQHWTSNENHSRCCSAHFNLASTSRALFLVEPVQLGGEFHSPLLAVVALWESCNSQTNDTILCHWCRMSWVLKKVAPWIGISGGGPSKVSYSRLIFTCAALLFLLDNWFLTATLCYFEQPSIAGLISSLAFGTLTGPHIVANESPLVWGSIFALRSLKAKHWVCCLLSCFMMAEGAFMHCMPAKWQWNNDGQMPAASRWNSVCWYTHSEKSIKNASSILWIEALLSFPQNTIGQWTQSKMSLMCCRY